MRRSAEGGADGSGTLGRPDGGAGGDGTLANGGGEASPQRRRHKHRSGGVGGGAAFEDNPLAA